MEGTLASNALEIAIIGGMAAVIVAFITIGAVFVFRLSNRVDQAFRQAWRRFGVKIEQSHRELIEKIDESNRELTGRDGADESRNYQCAGESYPSGTRRPAGVHRAAAGYCTASVRAGTGAG